MTRRSLVYFLILSFGCLAGPKLLAQSVAVPDGKRIEKARSAIAKLGTGRSAVVEVVLRDGTKRKGYVGSMTNDSFVLVDAGTGSTSTVSFNQVKRIRGANWSTGKKVALGFGIAGIVLAVLIIWGLTHQD